MTADDYLECGRQPNGRPLLRVFVIHWLGILLGIQFKIGGWPYGASYERAVNMARKARVSAGSAK